MGNWWVGIGRARTPFRNSKLDQERSLCREARYAEALRKRKYDTFTTEIRTTCAGSIRSMD